MKRLGLLGGMSWESSIEYERWINEEVRDRLGGTASADLVIRSFNFADIEAMQESDDWDAAARTLAEAARDLQASGAEGIVLCTNTMHRVYDEVQAAVAVPMLHIADATAAAVRAQGISRVALLGTRYTMEQPFYADRLRAAGLEVSVPEEPDRTMIHAVIYAELVRGVVSPDSKRQYLRAIDRLVESGAEGVIAGCTEIELLVGPEDVRVPYFPTAYLHAQAAARFALEP
ncbi:MAG: aspartate/glutamate racemase family protein [Candidatus Nanopelagicales bacterium]|nr:MAG: aspartate/glutamate racemase family protein [Actinomycetota bacterium]HNE90178.1 aspartate/glutamate racemase family protein [Actinomycetota bacterium]